MRRASSTPAAWGLGLRNNATKLDENDKDNLLSADAFVEPAPVYHNQSLAPDFTMSLSQKIVEGLWKLYQVNWTSGKVDLADLKQLGILFKGNKGARVSHSIQINSI
jgi:hypothetical protein